jgi:hypothetical protein
MSLPKFNTLLQFADGGDDDDDDSSSHRICNCFP